MAASADLAANHTVRLDTFAPKRILIVVANAGMHPTLQYPVGFWAAELAHPWYEFTEAGFDVTVASPKGGKVEVDGFSDPRDASKWSIGDILSLGFLTSPISAPLLERTPALGTLDLTRYDALAIAGGQSPMFSFRDDAALHHAIRTFYESNRVVAAYCHGTAALVDCTLSDGSYLVTGKTVTGFANVEEDYSDAYVGATVMPWRIEDALRARGANYVQGGLFKQFVVRDGRLITGQQQYSGRNVAHAIVAALGA